MFKLLIPLLPYMRRYSRAYVWGGIVAVLSSAVWVFFPHVIGIAIDPAGNHIELIQRP